jgi:hypothetical protein
MGRLESAFGSIGRIKFRQDSRRHYGGIFVAVAGRKQKPRRGQPAGLFSSERQ